MPQKEFENSSQIYYSLLCLLARRLDHNLFVFNIFSGQNKKFTDFAIIFPDFSKTIS